jgi:hypothetical protein
MKRIDHRMINRDLMIRSLRVFLGAFCVRSWDLRMHGSKQEVSSA